MTPQSETPAFNRRYRRSSEPMIALWCLFEHVCQRYCLQSAVLIDNFGNELVSAGKDWHEKQPAAGDEVEAFVEVMHAADLPGRKLPGLIVVRGPQSIIRSSIEDLEQGMQRIFEENSASKAEGLSPR